MGRKGSTYYQIGSAKIRPQLTSVEPDGAIDDADDGTGRASAITCMGPSDLAGKLTGFNHLGRVP